MHSISFNLIFTNELCFREVVTSGSAVGKLAKSVRACRAENATSASKITAIQDAAKATTAALAARLAAAEETMAQRVAAAERAAVSAEAERELERQARNEAVAAAQRCAEAARAATGLTQLAEKRRAAAEAQLAAALKREEDLHATLAAAEAGRLAAIKQLKDGLSERDAIQFGTGRAKKMAKDAVDVARLEARIEAAKQLQTRAEQKAADDHQKVVALQEAMTFVEDESLRAEALARVDASVSESKLAALKGTGALQEAELLLQGSAIGPATVGAWTHTDQGEQGITAE
eukprot:SAG31_NODE_3272_length_4477_cov_1.981270_4_plen_290_part_00